MQDKRWSRVPTKPRGNLPLTSERTRSHLKSSTTSGQCIWQEGKRAVGRKCAGSDGLAHGKKDCLKHRKTRKKGREEVMDIFNLCFRSFSQFSKSEKIKLLSLPLTYGSHAIFRYVVQNLNFTKWVKFPAIGTKPFFNGGVELQEYWYIPRVLSHTTTAFFPMASYPAHIQMSFPLSLLGQQVCSWSGQLEEKALDSKKGLPAQLLEGSHSMLCAVGEP